MRAFVILVIGLAFTASCPLVAETGSFLKVVLPILESHCFE